MGSVVLPSSLPRRTQARLALSRREAAQLLGIDRGRTLGLLIAQGKLRLVPWGTGSRIPRCDVEKLAQEGWSLTPARAAPTRRRSRRTTGLTDAEIRSRLADF